MMAIPTGLVSIMLVLSIVRYLSDRGNVRKKAEELIVFGGCDTCRMATSIYRFYMHADTGKGWTGDV